MTLTKIRIGTRKSALAMVQANMARDLLLAAHPGLEVEVIPLLTSGDRLVDRPLSEFGGKGLFTKEIEEALLDGRADIGVHSTKDMATVLPPGLVLGCFLPREDPCDMLVTALPVSTLADLPKKSVVGTSSLRRAAQILMKRPDVVCVPLRGNVETRLKKLAAGEFGATLLAVAGLNRLGIRNLNGFILPADEFLPAPAQGAIGIECREGDFQTRELLAPLNHPLTEQAVTCERAFLREMDGSCRTPIAGYAKIFGDGLSFRGLVVRPDGSVHHETQISGAAQDALKLGMEAGKILLSKAGKNFLD